MKTRVMGRWVGYDESGAGKSLVLIHGFPLNRLIWKAQWDGLADVAHVIAPDLRGFGESPMVEGNIVIDTYADDVREFLDARGIHEPAVICGLSMGGYIALAYQRRYPAHVAALILANTRAGPDTPEGKAGRDRNIALVKEKGASAIVEVMLPKLLAPKTFERNLALVEQVKRIMESASAAGIMAALAAMRDRPDSIPTLLEFSTPTLIIAGADDQLIPLSEAEEMKQAARNGTLVVIPEAGHLTPMEQPDAFNHAVREFLQGLRG